MKPEKTRETEQMKRSMLKSVNSVGIPTCCSGAFVIEPHASGYPHFHVIVFAEIPEFLQEKIKQPWPEKCRLVQMNRELIFQHEYQMKISIHFVIIL